MCGVVVGEEGLSDTDVAFLSRTITAGRPPSPEPPRAAALRLLVLELLLGEDMVTVAYGGKNVKMRNEKMRPPITGTDPTPRNRERSMCGVCFAVCLDCW